MPQHLTFIRMVLAILITTIYLLLLLTLRPFRHFGTLITATVFNACLLFIFLVLLLLKVFQVIICPSYLPCLRHKSP